MLGVEVLRPDGCVDPSIQPSSSHLPEAPEQAFTGLFRCLKGHYCLGAAGCFFACACGRSLRRVSESFALKG